jgi:hypothetical protein
MTLHLIFTVEVPDYNGGYKTHYVKWDETSSSIRLFVNDGNGEVEVVGGSDLNYTPDPDVLYMVQESDGDIANFRQIQSSPYAELVSIEQAPPPSLTLTYTKQDPSYIGGNDGAVYLTASNGTSPYTYSKDSVNYQTSSTFSGLSAGGYTFWVKDSTGATTSVSFSLNDPAPTGPVKFLFSFISASDYGGRPGTTDNLLEYRVYFNEDTHELTVRAFDQQTGAEYFPQSLYENHHSVGGLIGPITHTTTGDKFYFLGTDQHPYATLDRIESANPLTISTSVVHATVNGGNGSISASVGGGKAPYKYRLDDGAWTENTTASWSVPAGTYYVNVTDGNNNNVGEYVTVLEPPLLTLVSKKNVTNTTTPNGYIKVQASGGTSTQYSYSINNGAYVAGSNIYEYNSLSAGSYTIKVKDGAGLIATLVVEITESPIVLTLVSTTNATTIGGTNGAITVNVAGGATPIQYTYTKDGVTVSQYQVIPNNQFTITGLGIGVYTITVKDTDGLTKTVTTTVLEPLGVYYSVIPTNSSDYPNGKLIIDGTSKILTAVYFSLVFPDATSTAWSSNTSYLDLNQGTYTIKAKDDNGRTWEGSFTLSYQEALDLMLSLLEKEDLLLKGKNSGWFKVVASGGVSPYVYTIDNVEWVTEPVFTNLYAGTYTVTVKDDINNTASILVDLTEPPFNYESVVGFKTTLYDTGYLHTTDDESDEYSEEAPSAAVSGVTESKLEQVRSYNLNAPYEVGVNGVTEVTAEYVVYVIDSITYTTTLADGYTTYSFGTAGLTRDNSISKHVVKKESDMFTAKHKTINNISIDRSEISVFETMYRIANINTLDDFDTYL